MLNILFRKIWEGEQVLMDWEEGCLIKIPKKNFSERTIEVLYYCQYQAQSPTVSLNRVRDLADAQLRDK